MSNEELLSLVQHVWPSDRSKWCVDADLPKLQQFAALVQRDTAEDCAKVCEGMVVVLHPSQVITERCAQAIRTKYQLKWTNSDSYFSGR